MFALSDARDYSFSKVSYLEREEEITDQSNFVNNVTQFYFRLPCPLKKNGGQTGEKLQKTEKDFKGWLQESYRNTEQDIVALPPGPNVTLWNPLTPSQILEVVTSKNDASLTLRTVNLYCK